MSQITSKSSILPPPPPQSFNINPSSFSEPLLKCRFLLSFNSSLLSILLISILSSMQLSKYPYKHKNNRRGIHIKLAPYSWWLFVACGSSSSWSMIPETASSENLLEIQISEPHPSLNGQFWWWGSAFSIFSKLWG